jgi:hypothetical protein
LASGKRSGTDCRIPTGPAWAVVAASAFALFGCSDLPVTCTDSPQHCIAEALVAAAAKVVAAAEADSRSQTTSQLSRDEVNVRGPRQCSLTRIPRPSFALHFNLRLSSGKSRDTPKKSAKLIRTTR